MSLKKQKARATDGEKKSSSEKAQNRGISSNLPLSHEDEKKIKMFVLFI